MLPAMKDPAAVVFCESPWLVSLEFELPADPAIAYTTQPLIIGCNQLVCRDCGAAVRHVDSRSIDRGLRPTRAELEGLYASADPASSALLDHRPINVISRAYVCRCDWSSVDLSGARRIPDTDLTWRCAGHAAAPPRDETRRLDAATAASDPMRATIKLYYAPSVNPSFSTARELRGALLSSWPDADYFQAPVVGTGGREGTMAAWGWVAQLLTMRSDWWPVIGVALQHATTDGGDFGRRALLDLLGGFNETIVLVPWMTPLARRWPDVAAGTTATNWGAPSYTLPAVVREQTALLDACRASTNLFLGGYIKEGQAIQEPFTTAADLRRFLDKTARAGRSPGGDTGPWSWLGFELAVRPWVRPAFVDLVMGLDVSTPSLRYALLDWFSEERDLWQFVELLEGWLAAPPPWWSTSASTKPRGWKRTMRSAHWPDVETMGDVVREAHRRAALQAATPPIDDLPVLFPPE
jgi:hypothetical protein